jgi:hypothetical protein
MFKKEDINSEFIVQCKRKCFSSSMHLLEVLQEQIEHYCVLGNTVVIGDLNGRIGKENDYMYIVDDIINKQLRDNLTGLIDYECDLPSTKDIKPANKCGRKILNLCKSSDVRVCSGR